MKPLYDAGDAARLMPDASTIAYEIRRWDVLVRRAMARANRRFKGARTVSGGRSIIIPLQWEKP